MDIWVLLISIFTELKYFKSDGKQSPQSAVKTVYYIYELEFFSAQSLFFLFTCLRWCDTDTQRFHQMLWLLQDMMLTMDQLHLSPSLNYGVVITLLQLSCNCARSAVSLLRSLYMYFSQVTLFKKENSNTFFFKEWEAKKHILNTPFLEVQDQKTQNSLVQIHVHLFQLLWAAPVAAFVCLLSLGGADMISPGFHCDFGVMSPVDFPFCLRWLDKKLKRCA